MSVRATGWADSPFHLDVFPAFPAVVTSGQVNGSTAALARCVLRHACRYLPAQALDISRLRDVDAGGVRSRAV